MASLLVGMGMGKWEFPYVFPIFPLSIAPPWVIGKVLTWCVVIIIKTITFTHVIREIPVIVMRINITCKCIFTTTLRTAMSSAASTILLKYISIFVHTISLIDTILHILFSVALFRCVELRRGRFMSRTKPPFVCHSFSTL